MGSKGESPKAEGKPLDDSKTQPSVRGTLLPYILGCARVGGVFGAVGNRSTYEVENKPGEGGGGGKGGSPPEPEPTYTTYYREKGWHMMANGLGRSIKVISSGGAQSGTLNKTSYPSGSAISLGTSGENGDMGVFRVYWGEDSQPSNGFLNSRLGISSTWPHVFHIVWEPRELGTSATWPSQEFEIEVDTLQTTVGGKPSYMKFGSKSGVNPAAALWQMIFEPYPFGLGISQDEYNIADFTVLAELFAEDGPEPFPCTIKLAAGKSFKEGISSLLEDAGIGWWYDTTISKMRLTPVRKELSYTVIPQNDYLQSDLEMTFDYAVMSPNSVVYAFDDRNRAFYRSTFRETNDGTFKLSMDPNAAKVDLNTVTDYDTANMVAARRAQENQPRQEVPLTLSENFMDIPIGGLYQIEGLPSLYRIKSATPDLNAMQTRVIFVRDVYSMDNTYESVTQEIIPPDTLEPLEDIQSVLMETNRILTPDSDGIALFKVRAHNQISSSAMLLSPDGVSYTNSPVASGYSTGGTLNAGISITDATFIEEGPTITNVGPDILNVADLSSSEQYWRSGAQVCIIGGEVFFLRSILAISATEYRLQGLIRARAGTEKEAHLTGDPVYILPESLFLVAAPKYLSNGSTVYAKTVPRTSESTLQPDDVSAISLTYSGGGYRPLEITSLNTQNLSKYWIAGDDVPLRWSYRTAGSKSGAGTIKTGASGAPVDPEGVVTILFTDGVDIKRTVTDITGSAYTYLNSEIVTDFGSEPTEIYAIVYVTLNGLISDQTQIIITKYEVA